MNKYDSDEILHVKNGDVEYLQFKVLNEYNIKHCITLRHGGASDGEYSSLNFRTLGNDSVDNVFQNLKIIKNKVGFSNIYKGKQDHTDRVIVLNNENKDDYLFEKLSKDNVDGYIVNEKDIATLVTTADCNPIIIYDPINNVISNIHAGWKGVINRIYINAIEKMQHEFNSNPSELIVCIGPSIRKCCFTSREESFKEKFTSVFKYESEYLEDKEDGTFHIDLVKILKHEMKEVGVLDKNIHVADICTRCNTDDFYSYRAAVQNGKKAYATFATIVQLSENNVK